MSLRSTCPPLLLVLIALTACSSPATDDAENARGASEELATHGFPGPVTQPDGGYVADVTAAGTGCPAGSWSAIVSPDGQAFTLIFSAYEVKLSPGQLFDMKQCVVNVGFRDPEGLPLSFVLGSFTHQGYAALDSGGMRAARNTTYTFSANGVGVPSAAPRQHAELAGPWQDSYEQTDTVFSGQWSPCASVSNLVVNTNLMLQNNAQRSGSGYLNAATVDGALTVAFRLAWRRC
jgi:hypothetical protein